MRRLYTIVPLILRDDFLCYNTNVNLADLLKRSLDSSLLDLIHRIADESSALGFPIHLVGGSVRDLLLARPIVDLDLTLEGDAIKLGRALVKKYGGDLTTHEKFFTATWTPQFSNSQILDLISARRETYPHLGALPTVTKSTLDDDLRRRDFTINAMAIRVDSDHFGELYDPLHGQSDLEKKLIRVLHPNSFLDDPTRIFRAVRYAERYGFTIEPETLKLINDDSRKVLSGLSGERLRHEFDLIFEEPNPSAILKQLFDVDIFRAVHPQLQVTSYKLLPPEEPSPTYGEFAVPDMLSFNQTLCWVLWLMNSSLSEIEDVAERLAFPVLLTNTVITASALKSDLPSFKNWKPSQWTFHLDDLPSLSIFAVYLVSGESALSDYLSKWQHVKPITTGDDLKARGLEPGPRFGEILRQLRAAWLDGEVKTAEEERQLLASLLKN
ncbi:MAG: CCA-adding enzyme [Anaerolineales bacterium]|nr:CCA-adding enzyme [Anaerolineales bacterium]